MTKVEELGYIDKGTGKHQSNVVYNGWGGSTDHHPLIRIQTTANDVRGLVPCKLDKKYGGIHGFHASEEHRVKGLNCKEASAVTQRYYKGVNADCDNMVLEIICLRTL